MTYPRRAPGAGVTIIEGPPGKRGEPGTPGTDATVTKAKITEVLGQPPATTDGAALYGPDGSLLPVGSAVLPPGLFPGGVLNYGDSLSVGFGSRGQVGSWAARLATMLGTTFDNQAVSGTAGGRSAAVAGALQQMSAAVKSDDLYPRRAWPAGNKLVCFGYLFNDLNLDGGTAALGPLISNMRAMIARALTARLAENNDLVISNAAGTGVGSFVVVNATDRNSGDVYFETTADGDYFVYITPDNIAPGSAVVIGGPVKAGSVGFIDLSINGQAVKTIDLSAVAARASGQYASWTYRATGLTPNTARTTQNIKGVARGLSGGTTMTIDCMDLEAPLPPPVIVRGMDLPISTNGYWTGSVAQRDADITAGNNALKALCAEFVRPGGVNPVLFLDAASVINKDPACYAGSQDPAGNPFQDGLHWGDEGYRRLAAEAYRLLLKYYRDYAASSPAAAV